MFRQFAKSRGDIDNKDARVFSEFENSVVQILNEQGKTEARINEWINAAEARSLFGESGESIPEYNGEEWNDQWDSLDAKEDYEFAVGLDIWRFYQVVSLHRNHVSRDLFPKHNLIVD